MVGTQDKRNPLVVEESEADYEGQIEEEQEEEELPLISLT